MTRLIAFLLFGLLGLMPPALAAQTTQPAKGIEDPVVVTAGSGVSRAAADRAYLDVSVESRAAVPRDAQRRTAEAMTAVQTRLRALGIAPDALRTTMAAVNREYDFTSGRRTPKGYVAVNSIEVRVDALERLGEVLDGAVAAGATAVGDVRFDVRDRSAHEREALRAAVADARARADAMAAGAGKAVDRIVRVEEQGTASPPMPMGAMALRSAAGPAADTPVSAGPIEFRAHVTLTVTLK